MNEQHPGEKNLNTFKILFLIKGIFDLLIALLGFIYIAIGSFTGPAFEAASRIDGQTMPMDPGSFFMIIGVVLLVLAMVTGIPALMASNRWQQKRGRNFIIVAAAINCLTGVLGILLCIFTVIELQKPEVKELFDENDR
ncbi:MAG: hypothetical protein NXI10_12290 [bacterium]|nr:hypothetical protein [bacterium]